MMKNIYKKLFLTTLAGTLLLTACHHQSPSSSSPSPSVDYSLVAVPNFLSDSALQFVKDQIAFGPRTPGSTAHMRCASYLVNKMRQWCDTVLVQEFTTTLWDGSSAKGKNIIASINPSNTHRILLAAHWDSRLWADHDSDPANHHTPIPGANDGASGVATLMEMARTMSAQRPNVGIDIIFFDIEDQGIPEWADTYADNTWCKGSQHWAQHPHTPYYTALYGVLFDMVGSRNPRFTKEEVSRQYASSTLDKFWNVAEALGYGNVFQNQKTPPILDDHMYINQIIGIPTIDIVQNTEGCNFFPFWHTVEDDLDVIDPEAMKKVATVTMKTIYGDYGE